ncbi:MAG: hypothetical protein APF77_13195 [Clostridia bacterium BRH_c25]|nr:MAG: hypothetical protein APF77_13195 [Clostridia bacterium BRH_c25]
MVSHFLCPFIQHTLTGSSSCSYAARTMTASSNYYYGAKKGINNSLSRMHTLSTLDTIRLEQGATGLKAFFSELSKKDYKEALSLVNEESLHFSSLYILKPEIEALNLFDYLSLRNKIAIAVLNEVLSGNKSMPPMKCSSSEYIQTVCSVLKWILISGFIDDGFEDDYDKVLDASSALLIKVYGDRTVLPLMSDLIFERNRRGRFYNELVWAFFESRYPHGLILIAAHLLSEQPEDVRLAQRLLSFIPGIDTERTAAYERQHSIVLNWLEKNYPYLYFTGESFQQSVSPKPYRVILDARYLCKAISIDTGRTIEPLTEYEDKLLKEFSELGTDVKKMLSIFSHMTHNNNIHRWNSWIHRPIAEQVEIAGLWMGGAV